MDRIYTDFLTTDGSLLLGAGSVFSVAGNYFSFNRSANGALADARALRQDFAMVGQDVRDVAESARKSSTAQLPLAL